MKIKFFSTVYILIIFFYLIQPVLPYIIFIAGKNYISKNLCIEKDKTDNSCHGSCILNEQLEKNSDNNESAIPGNKNTERNKKIEEHLRSIQVIIKPSEINLTRNSYYLSGFGEPHAQPVFIPPKG